MRRRIQNGLGVLAGVILLTALARAEEARATEGIGKREWSNAAGKKFEATLVGFTETHVELATRDKSYTIPVTTLSAADQAVVAALRERAGNLQATYAGNREPIKPEDVAIAYLFERKNEMEGYLSDQVPGVWARVIEGKVERIERRISEQQSAIIFEGGLICVAYDKDLIRSTHKLVNEGRKLVSVRNDARGTDKKVICEEEVVCYVRGTAIEHGNFGLIKGIKVVDCDRAGPR